MEEENYRPDQLIADFESGLDGIAALSEAHQINDKQAYDKYRALQLQFKEKEDSHNKSVKTVAAVAVGAAAIGGLAYAASKGSGGGGYSTPNDSYQGCCSWHNGVSYCDAIRHRLVCMDGQYSPSCGC
jgi:hypothetical protein